METGGGSRWRQCRRGVWLVTKMEMRKFDARRVQLGQHVQGRRRRGSAHEAQAAIQILGVRSRATVVRMGDQQVSTSARANQLKRTWLHQGRCHGHPHGQQHPSRDHGSQASEVIKGVHGGVYVEWG